MKKIDLGQAITILANIGVIAGIIFLGVELQQNNEFLEAQARSDREAVRRGVFERYLQNPALIEATLKAESGEELTEQEASLVNWANRATLWDWRYVYREYQEGLLDETTMPIAGWQVTFRNSVGLSETWSARKVHFEPDFVEWMEQNIVNR